MKIILTFLEVFFVIMLYNASVNGIDGNIRKYIIQGGILSSIGTILYLILIDMGILATFIVVFILALILSKRESKNIIVVIMEVVIGFLFVTIIELVSVLLVLSLTGANELSGYFSFMILVIYICIFIPIVNKKFKNRRINFEEIILRYKNIVLYITNIVIFSLFLKVLFQYSNLDLNTLVQCTILLFLLLSVNIYFFVDIYNKSKINKKCELKESINPLIQELIDEMKAKEHEYKNHLNILYCMMQVSKEDELREKAKKYIGDVYSNDDILANLSHIDNNILKAILLNKVNQAEKKDITFTYEISSQLEEIPLDDSELTVVLSNLLNNSIESASMCEEKIIELVIENIEGKYIITVMNSVKNLSEDMMPEIQKVGVSTKGLGRGYGIYNIEKIIKKYKGKIDMSIVDELFCVAIEI